MKAAHVAVHAISVRPICFDDNCGEALFFDEPAGDLRPCGIKLVSTVRGFAEQDKAALADRFQQRVIVARLPPKRVSGIANCFD